MIIISFTFSCSLDTESDDLDSIPVEINGGGNSGDYTGAIRLRITENDLDKTTAPGVDMKRKSFSISGSCDNGSRFVASTRVAAVDIKGLPAGEWQIAVEAVNAGDMFIAYGSGSAQVAEKTVSPLRISLAPYREFNTIELRVEWAPGVTVNPMLTGKLARASGIPFNILFDIDGSSAAAEITAPAGYYILQVNLYDNAGGSAEYRGGAVEVLQIACSKSLPDVYTVVINTDEEYGNLDISVLVDMQLPVYIALSGLKEICPYGEAMNITASSPGETEIEYTWYLNGETAGTGGAYTVRNNLRCGNYRLDVTAYSVTDDRAGSAGYDFLILCSGPEDLRIASAAGTQARLEWKENYDNEKGFIIERSAGGAFAVVGNAPANSTSFTDNTLSPGTAYNYRIKAFWGNVNTDYSNEVHLPVGPQSLSYANESAVYTSGIEIVQNTATIDIDDGITFSVVPELPEGLSFNVSNGTISGTPLGEHIKTDYTITAANFRGSAVSVISITVNYPAPTGLSYAVSNAVYSVGGEIEPNTAALTGQGLTFSVSPVLPEGLIINTFTGTISGTPETEALQTNYTIIAANSGGSVSTTISIKIIYPAPAGLSYAVTNAVYTVGQAIISNTAAITGQVLTFSVSPVLPVGLIINTSTGTISGAPETEALQANYTITAANSGGSVSTTISIKINYPAPTGLSYAVTNAVYTVDQAITANTATITGQGLTFSVSLVLPKGLIINTSTGTISGTPTAETSQTNYTITAANSGGSISTTISFRVNYPAPAGLSYAVSNAVYSVGEEIEPNTPSVSGQGLTFSITPALPAGLALSSSTGVISGRPLSEKETASYTVRAANSGGFTETVITIMINLPAPEGLFYAEENPFYIVDESEVYNTASVTGDGITFSITPALSCGLSFNTATGAITGFPNAELETTAYTVRASNSGGFCETTVTIKIYYAPPSGLSYATPNAVYTVDESVFPNKAAVTGYEVSFSIEPSLPDGLHFDTEAGNINGKPRVESPQTQYRVTAWNIRGSVFVDIFITVNYPAPPALSYTVPDAVYTVDQAIPNNNAIIDKKYTYPLNFSVTPALPAGLNIDTAAGTIYGTPETHSPETSYTVLAENSGGVSAAIISIKVIQPAYTGMEAGIAAPSDFSATVVSAGQIDLAWQDNADNEEGFLLFRMTPQDSDFVLVADIDADAESYSDTGINYGGEEMWYRIYAYNYSFDLVSEIVAVHFPNDFIARLDIFDNWPVDDNNWGVEAVLDSIRLE